MFFFSVILDFNIAISIEALKRLSLNISYNFSLTEKDYYISFVDHTYNITDVSNIWYKFDISSNYDLSLNNYYTTTNGAYAVITGGLVKGDEITVID
jgi:hypothetical protein